MRKYDLHIEIENDAHNGNHIRIIKSVLQEVIDTIESGEDQGGAIFDPDKPRRYPNSVGWYAFETRNPIH